MNPGDFDIKSARKVFYGKKITFEMKIDEAFQEMFPKNYNWPEICQLGYAQFLVKKSSQLSLSRQENSKFSPTLQTFQIIDDLNISSIPVKSSEER